MDGNRSMNALKPSNITSADTMSPEKDVYSIKLYVLMLIMMSCVGTIGNILIIGALFVHKKLRSMGNVFIDNLAVCDLCISAIICL